MLTRIPLEHWRFTPVPGPAEGSADTIPPALAAAAAGDGSTGWPATVPGCVHDDLLAAGLVADPYLDDNEAGQLWIGRTAWRYCTVLPAEALRAGRDAAERLDLVCEGLDTVAEIRLGEHLVGTTQNMHRCHRFDVSGLVAPEAGDDVLEITFAPGLDEAERRSELLGPRPRTEPHPFNAIRKMACSYGWDWNIQTVSAGIWRPIRLERWRTGRLADVVVDAVPRPGGGGELRARVSVERLDHSPLAVRVQCGSHETVVDLPGTSSAVSLELDIDDARLWWPVGHGDQPLYDVTVSLERAGNHEPANRELDRATRRVGFRSIRVDLTPDADGTGMTFVVNDQPVMVRGVNWIPDDALVTRVDRRRTAARVRDAVQANCNLLRVWGGGIFASDDLAEVCDREGVLLWQDCLLACEMVSEDEPLRSELEAEVRENLARLSQHPCLAVVCGGNENLWAFVEWGWRDELAGRSWGEHYYLEMFPRLVAEVAPRVPYVPGSPFSPPHEPPVAGATPDAGPNDPRWGAVHLWQQWNTLPASTYRDVRPRFVAEFGWQSLPSWSTLTGYVHDQPLRPDGPQMLVHQKAGNGVVKMTNGLESITGVPDDMESWHWASQYVQADAVRTAISWFRSLQPLCTGTIWWQLNDAWPVASWALVDWCGVRKPAWFALREVYQPRLLTLQPEDGRLWLVALNDTDDPWQAQCSVRLVPGTGDGAAGPSASLDLAVPARGEARWSVDIDLFDAASSTDADDRVQHALLAEADGVRAWWWAAPPRGRDLPAADVGLRIVAPGVVELTAHTLLVDACLLVDKLTPGAGVDAGLFSLLPHESVQLQLTGLDAVTPEQLRTVLVCANDFAHTH